MTSWGDRLNALAHDRLPAEVAAKWTGLFQPGIRLTAAGEGPRLGQLGGDPAPPATAEWPNPPGRGPLNFVAAVDCAALPREFLSIPLPEAGTLLFFFFDDSRRSADEECDLLDGAEDAHVRYVPAGVPVTERAAPDGVFRYPRQELFGAIVATAPERAHVLLDRTTTASGTSLTDAVAGIPGPGYLGADVFGELVQEAGPEGPRHQVGGFATPVQDAVENEAAAAVLDGSWQDPRLAEEAANWVLLAQFDTEDDADMMWGDVGMLYWVIRTDDLAAGRFDRARCILQCY